MKTFWMRCRMRCWMRCCVLALCLGSATAAECRAVIIAGDPGEGAAWAGNFSRWTAGWQHVLEQEKVPAANVRVLAGAASSTGATNSHDNGSASREQVVHALEDLAKACAPDDQAVVVLIGHGYQSEGVGKLCLVGPDLADAEVAKALLPLRAKHAAVLVMAPEGAAWAKALAKPGRVVLCANVKQSAPYFCEFLLRALKPETPLLDAFNGAAFATVAWYQNQFLNGEEKDPNTDKDRGTIVHGRENQEIYRLVYAGAPFAEGEAEPRAAINDLNDHKGFTGRRVLAEVAGLEDDGDGVPATIFDAGKGATKAVGSGGSGDPAGSGNDGALARTLVLGRP